MEGLMRAARPTGCLQGCAAPACARLLQPDMADSQLTRRLLGAMGRRIGALPAPPG